MSYIVFVRMNLDGFVPITTEDGQYFEEFESEESINELMRDHILGHCLYYIIDTDTETIKEI